MPSTALVPLDPTRCPACSTELDRDQWAQPALVRHGGYGATEQNVAPMVPRLRMVAPTEPRHTLTEGNLMPERDDLRHPATTRKAPA